ncbi:MAG: hypothetical protein RXQ99_09515 [Acidianus sp.]|jgi:hypothetical protein|uniref:hypothetical protein n=1 Tax=Acidianus sp. TaxID=1872104 RepID=UPI00397C6E14
MSLSDRVKPVKELLGTVEAGKPTQGKVGVQGEGNLDFLHHLHSLYNYPYTPQDLKSAIKASLTSVQGLVMLASAIDLPGLSGERLVGILNRARVGDDARVGILVEFLTEARQVIAGGDRDRGWLRDLIDMVIGGEGKGKAP